MQMTAEVSNAPFLLPGPLMRQAAGPTAGPLSWKHSALVHKPTLTATGRPSQEGFDPSQLKSIYPRVLLLPPEQQKAGGSKVFLPRGNLSRVCTSALRPGPSCLFPVLELHIHASNDFHMQKKKLPRTTDFLPFPPFPSSGTRAALLPAASQWPPILTRAETQTSMCTVLTPTAVPSPSGDLSTDLKGGKHLTVATNSFCAARTAQPRTHFPGEPPCKDKSSPQLNGKNKSRYKRNQEELFSLYSTHSGKLTQWTEIKYTYLTTAAVKPSGLTVPTRFPLLVQTLSFTPSLVTASSHCITPIKKK